MLRAAGVLCAASMMLALAAPAQAAAITSQPAASLHDAEWSSTHKGTPHRKKAGEPAVKRKRAVTARTVQARPRRVWSGPDPSFDEYGRLYTNPYPGKCMVDLGYGRWADCSSDP
jgi:hypothetical protein